MRGYKAHKSILVSLKAEVVPPSRGRGQEEEKIFGQGPTERDSRESERQDETRTIKRIAAMIA